MDQIVHLVALHALVQETLDLPLSMVGGGHEDSLPLEGRCALVQLQLRHMEDRVDGPELGGQLYPVRHRTNPLKDLVRTHKSGGQLTSQALGDAEVGCGKVNQVTNTQSHITAAFISRRTHLLIVPPQLLTNTPMHISTGMDQVRNSLDFIVLKLLERHIQRSGDRIPKKALKR